MEKGYTSRGFAVFSFRDGNGEKAAIQQSSAAEEPHVWIGVDELKLKRFVPGRSWSDCPLPEGDVHGNERLHLTRENVRDLLPILQRFVDTGDIDDRRPGEWPDGYDGNDYPTATDFLNG